MNSWERLAQIQRQTAPYMEAHRRPKVPRFRVENKAGAETEVYIYGEIGGPWGIKAEEIGKALRDARPSPVTIRIHSEGGSAFEAVAIHALLKEYVGAVSVKIDGLASSAGSIIAVAGDYVSISPGGQVFIHDATGMVYGDAADHAFMANLLNTTSETIASLYARKAGDDSATWRKRMLANNGLGSWYNAEQAVDLGLADEVFEANRESLAAQVGAGVFRGMLQARQDRTQLVAAMSAGAIVGIVRGIGAASRQVAAQLQRPKPWPLLTSPRLPAPAWLPYRGR